MVGDSNVVMAPFFGNRHGTCSIEVLTTENVKKEDWLPFCQSVLDKWAEYKDRNGQYLNIRPHWAKEWQGLKVRAAGPLMPSNFEYTQCCQRSRCSWEVDVCAQSARLVSMQVRGVPVKDYLRAAYADRIPEFKVTYLMIIYLLNDYLLACLQLSSYY